MTDEELIALKTELQDIESQTDLSHEDFPEATRTYLRYSCDQIAYILENI